ncbi:MAG: hypothetical protein A2Y82_00180 [Candidatus Buchananbacteria bacterium RBG_13_36_9]|uniref:Uncharacterized protein n=1 Tax=Candidatus Buchananbacteria bacterium RBG_13_36_9 TaxID=1797530 RepID=A0A1G1XN53_9BACT|nr:MAG: hypothetical protein A2Y82_00180 [Candidatus Buchananbacteria bacterium RBG_13_36_9]
MSPKSKKDRRQAIKQRSLKMARKEKSEFLSAFGTTFEIWKKIVDAVLSLGGNDEDIRRLLTDKSLAKKVAEVIMASKQKVSEIYKVVFDYGLSLAEMIKLGNYGWFNDDITAKNFPLQGTGKQESELLLVHLNRDVTTKEVLEYLNSQGLEPAKIEHLLAFGTTYPEVQREFPIVALGSSFVGDSGSRRCPYLSCSVGLRELRLPWVVDDNPWHGSCRFVAVRK